MESFKFGERIFNPDEEHPSLSELYKTAEKLECKRCGDGSVMVIRIRRADGSNEPFFSCPNYGSAGCRESLNWTGKTLRACSVIAFSFFCQRTPR